MNRLFALIIVFCLSFGTVFADGIIFKPGDEYKDIDLNAPVQVEEKAVFQEQSGLVSYNDMQDLSTVGILGALNIMGAYSDGKFMPNVFVSKIQYIEGVLNLVKCNPGDYVNVYKGEFYDVSDGYEKINVIYAALSLGIANGYPDNTFRGDEVISYNDAVTILVRALGYSQLAELRGGYPFGYLNVAADIGLLSGIRNETPEAITRITMAKMLYNALDAPIMEAVNLSGKDANFKQDDKSVLYTYYNLYKSTGVVNATNVTAIYGNPTAKRNIAIDSKLYNVEHNDFNAYLGYKVKYYYDADENKIVYMEKHKSVSEIVIASDDLAGFNPSSGQLSYYVNGVLKHAAISKINSVIYNGILLDYNYDESIYDINEGRIKLVSNDGGDAYDIVFIESCQNYVLKNISVSEHKLIFSPDFGIVNFEIDVNDTFVEIYLYTGEKINFIKYTDKGEKKMDISQIPSGFSLKDSVANVYVDYGKLKIQNGYLVPTDSAKYMKIVFSDKKLQGKITGYNMEDYEMAIDGVDYKISKKNYFDNDDSQINFESSTFYIDAMNKIVALKKGQSKDFVYGYLINAAAKKGLSGIIELKVMQTNGKKEVLQCVKDVRVNGKNQKEKTMDVLKNAAKMVNPDFNISQVIKYKVNEEGKVTNIQTVTASVGIADGYPADQLNRYTDDRTGYDYYYDATGRVHGRNNLKGYFAPKLLFQVPLTETFEDKNYTVTTFRESISNLIIDAFDVEDLTPNVMVWYTNAATDEKIVTGYNGVRAPVMVKNHSRVIMNEQESAKLTVAQANGIKDYYSDDLTMFDDVKPGQVVYLYGFDDNVTKVETCLYDGVEITPDNVRTLDITKTEPTGAFTAHTRFMEVYKVLTDNNFIVQCGPIIDYDKNIRQVFTTSRFMHTAWDPYGVLLYDETNGGEPIIRQGTISDLRSVVQNGEKASKVLFTAKYGAGISYLIYNFK